MLKITESFAALPAQDITRARQFYEQKLGFVASEELQDGSALYRTGNGGFLVFPSRGKATGDHTQLGLNVEDISTAVAELRNNGVRIEEYDYPDFKTKNGIVELPGGIKSAWFKDSEGNLIAVNQMVPAATATSTRGGATTTR